MFQVVPRRGRDLLILAAVIAVAACGGGSPTPSTATSSPSPVPTEQPSAVVTPSPSPSGGPGLAGAGAAMANLTSYKFTMTLAGGPFDDMYSNVGGSPASETSAFSVKGTVVLTPAKGTDVTIGQLHIVETGGFDYIDLDGSGFTQTQVQGAGLTDQWTPGSMFSAYGPSATGFNDIGPETKNGVAAEHYQAGAAALAEMGSVAGVANATWTADIWIAADGGYPVGVAIVAKASDNSLAYEMLFDLTNVNDPTNSVTTPANVIGE